MINGLDIRYTSKNLKEQYVNGLNLLVLINRNQSFLLKD